RGSHRAVFVHSSQNGQAVCGLKCHSMISRRCASSWSCAALTAAESMGITNHWSRLVEGLTERTEEVALKSQLCSLEFDCVGYGFFGLTSTFGASVLGACRAVS